MRFISTDYSQILQQWWGGFFSPYFWLWLFRVSACCRPLMFGLVSQQQRECFLNADFGKAIVLTTQHSEIAIFLYIFRGFLIQWCSLLTRLLTLYLAALRRLRSPFAFCDTDLKQSKTKWNIWEKKTHLLLRILTVNVIGRYGPHLMIVVIFVTQIT